VRITQAKARRLAIACQGLDGRWKLPKGKEGAAQVIERIGYLQIDTISVVERAHHHTLWSRCPGYEPDMLNELLADDRRVFEYWAPAASYLPIEDYRYYVPAMRGFAGSKRARHWVKNNRALAKQVKERIRKGGPLGSADFESPPGKRGSWWDWKPAKQALEMLFSMGELMVAERRNFQRIYDLADRVLPASIDTTEPDLDEMSRFVVRRCLASLGVASRDEIRWAHRGTKGSGALEELLASGEVTRVDFRGAEPSEQFVLTRVLEAASKRRARPAVHILSPFDNLTIRRGRLRALFGFDYSLECYHPEAKRRYGYFCLPILWGDEFIGRLDSKADRKNRTLVLKKLFFEPGFSAHDAVLGALAAKLRSFAEFNQCDEVMVESTSPAKVRSPLRKALR